MSALDQVKDTLKTPRGKTIAALALGGLAYLWWTRGRSSGAGSTGAPAEVTTQDRIPPASGGGGGGGDTLTPTDARPKDNGTWLLQAVSALSAPPYNRDPIAVYNALRKALDGLQVTTAEQGWVSEAIALKGSPPEGMPPLNTAPPNPTPSNPTPTPTTPAPVTPFTEPAAAGERVEAFNDRVSARLGHTVSWVMLEAANPSLATNVNWTKSVNDRTFKKNAVYLVPNGA